MVRPLIIAVPVVIGLVVATVFYTDGMVSRSRLERFARRQRLSITADNGDQVIRYLATVRRWRVAGFVGGIVASQFGAPEGQFFNVNFVLIFMGWFLGALVAEARVVPLGHGSVRTASLQPRRPQLYVQRFAWRLLPASVVAAGLVGAATGAAALVGWVDPSWPRVGSMLAAALIAAAVIRRFQQVVLDRPQPVAAPDLIEADDAIRSRSLHVLSGGGAALVLFLVLNLLQGVHPTSLLAEQLIEAAVVLGSFAVAFLGWLVATSVWPPPSAHPRPGIA